jgi:hypothetical protein
MSSDQVPSKFDEQMAKTAEARHKLQETQLARGEAERKCAILTIQLENAQSILATCNRDAADAQNLYERCLEGVWYYWNQTNE